MKRLFIATFLLLSAHVLFGQISTREVPVSFNTKISALDANEKTQKAMPAFNLEKIQLEDREDETNGMPPRFGYKHEVNYTLENSGEWTVLPNGDKIWRLVISSQGALSINLLYDKFWLPEGAKLFIYSSDHKHSIGAFTSANNKGNKNEPRGFATGLVYGDQITLEYYIPKNVKDTGIISIVHVIHGYKYITLPENMDVSNYYQSGNCQVNVNCDEGQNWQKEKNAIAMILVNGNRWCSGSLINTTANDYRPLFLTADHCLGGSVTYVKHDALGNPYLDYWSFYWHYEAPGCTNASPSIYSTNGATVIANNSDTDFALFELSEDPKDVAGITPYYLGWDRSGNAGTGGVGIHHPNGDIKKIATYNQTPNSFYNNNYWHLYWVQTPNGYSITEGGSSGSPLLNNSHRVIGQLYGSQSINCSDPANDYAVYGKFSVSWTGNGATDIRRRLDYWLDPNYTGQTTLNGLGTMFITGPEEVRPTAYFEAFYLENAPGGASILWSMSNNLVTAPSVYEFPDGSTMTLSVPPTTKIVKVNPSLPSSYSGTGWISATVYSSELPNGQETVTKTVNVFGSPAMSPVSNALNSLPTDSVIVEPFSLILSPNPASNELNVSFERLPTPENQSETYSVKLLDNNGVVQRQAQFKHHRKNGKAQPVKFNVSALKHGTYFLHVEGNGKIHKEQVIISD